MQTSSIRTKSITSVSSLLNLIEKIKTEEITAGNESDFLFRGQSTDQPLIPKIARLKPKGDLMAVEQLILTEFKRLSLPLTEFVPADEWDWLALAQHHGLPTRLLDWSYSALAALWFCVKKAPKEDNTGKKLDGVVWLLKTSPDDFIQFPTDESPFMRNNTRIFRSRSVSRRILAQAGVFTCHKRMKTGNFIPLQTNAKYKERLVKIKIPASSFGDIRNQLFACGVSNVSLFPDLDGLAGELQFRFFHDTAYKLL